MRMINTFDLSLKVNTTYTFSESYDTLIHSVKVRKITYPLYRVVNNKNIYLKFI